MRILIRSTFLALFLIGCAPRPHGIGPSGPPSSSHHQALEASISTCITMDGETMAELPLGRKHSLSLGMFFRVYDADEPDLIKGMIQVTELVGHEGSLARVIYLYDPKRPIRAGDTIMESDLAHYGSGDDLEARLREQAAQQEEVRAEDQEAFANLRRQYERELKELKDAYEAQIASLRSSHSDRIALLEAEQTRVLERKELERRTDLAALRATLDRRSSAEVEEEQAKLNTRIRDLETERTRLSNQITTLIAEQQRLHTQIKDMVSNESALSERHERELRAEVESREVLRRRITELERIIAGEDQTAENPVLVTDAERSETILERLDRIIGERDEARRQNAVLQAQMQALRDEKALIDSRIATLGQQLTTSTTRISELENSIANQDGNLQIIQSLREQFARAQEHINAITLARLEAERNLYILATRLLRLDDRAPSVKALQESIASMLEGELGNAGQDTAPLPSEEP